MIIGSRFATKEELLREEFAAINRELYVINQKYDLPDQTVLNIERFPWSIDRFPRPSLYVSRMWEYPYAILAADLQPGMTCADIGCGTSPFTLLLAEKTGRQCVTGFDPDERNDLESPFGANRSFLKSHGIVFERNDMRKLNAADSTFDRVFCLSVLEHLDEPAIWQEGMREMVRVLKPGGRLILTVDLGIRLPLTRPLDIIQHSGLSVLGSFDNRWPRERFLVIDGVALDVFGMILEKSNERIFLDYGRTIEISQAEANQRFTPPIYDSQQIQIGRDLRRSPGGIRVLAKLLSGKYLRRQ